MKKASVSATSGPRRREVLLGALGLGGLGLLPAGNVGALLAANPEAPGIAEGVQLGELELGRVMLWSRTDRPAVLEVRWSTRASMRRARTVRSAPARDTSAFAVTVELTGLPSATTVYFNARFVAVDDPGSSSAVVQGFFRTPDPRGTKDIRLVWSGDVCGQGFGISPEHDGLAIFSRMLSCDPDLFLHMGDTIYADNPIEAERLLPDGTVWHNLTNPEVAKVAESLGEFRARHRYNRQDKHVQSLGARVPMVALWDDHEVLNNWYPGEILTDERYTEKRVSVLAENAWKAFVESYPLRMEAAERRRLYRRFSFGPLLDIFRLDMRSWRGANGHLINTMASPESAFLGEVQLAWLISGLSTSTATWKVIAADMPLGLIVPDGEGITDNLANQNGEPQGRELELCLLLKAIKQVGVRNVVWLTADVHYTAAHHYAPERAQFKHFEPFWEFVSGPLHAISCPQLQLDNTFGPEVRFVKAPPPGQYLPPSAGLQFFGQVDVSAASRQLTVQLKDASGTALFTQVLNPEGV